MTKGSKQAQMEGWRGGPAVSARIRWTWPLDRELVNTVREADPSKRGYHQRLEALWGSKHSTMPSRGSPLAQRYLRIRAAETGTVQDKELGDASKSGVLRDTDESDVLGDASEGDALGDASEDEGECGTDKDAETNDLTRRLRELLKDNARGEGDLASRKLQVAKWAEPELLAWVNAIAEREWERCPHSWWHWNCLTYPAAQLVAGPGCWRREPR